MCLAIGRPKSELTGAFTQSDNSFGAAAMFVAAASSYPYCFPHMPRRAAAVALQRVNEEFDKTSVWKSKYGPGAVALHNVRAAWKALTF